MNATFTYSYNEGGIVTPIQTDLSFQYSHTY